MTPGGLEPRVAAALDAIFTAKDRDAATRLLIDGCGTDLPGLSNSRSLERIHLAALKCSDGRLEGLRDAIALAQTDWRDLLMAAGFGQIDAHLSWRP